MTKVLDNLYKQAAAWLDDPFNAVLVLSGFAGGVGGVVGGAVGVVLCKLV
jgi:hypothetical protein